MAICKRCKKKKAEAWFYGFQVCPKCFRIVRWKEKMLEKRLSELRRGRFLVKMDKEFWEA